MLKKRISKLHRDAAMLCSARATLCADADNTVVLSPRQIENVLKVSIAASQLANRALGICAWEFVFVLKGSVAMHYALAASVLLNGEVT